MVVENIKVDNLRFIKLIELRLASIRVFTYIIVIPTVIYPVLHVTAGNRKDDNLRFIKLVELRLATIEEF